MLTAGENTGSPSSTHSSVHSTPIPVISIPNTDLDYVDVYQGAFGTVYMVKNEPIVIKKYNDSIIYSHVEREIKHLYYCNHENVVKLLGIGPRNSKNEIKYIVMERATNGSLDRLCIGDRRCYGMGHVILWNWHLAKAVSYLHSNGLMHRDIKPSNCLLFNDYTVLKISDFGTARPLAGEKLTANVGTQLFWAPEVQKRPPDYNEKADVYSMIKVLWNLIGCLNLNSEPTTYLRHCPQFLMQLIIRGTSPDSKKRPTAKQLETFFEKLYNLFKFRNLALEVPEDYPTSAAPQTTETTYTRSAPTTVTLVSQDSATTSYTEMKNGAPWGPNPANRNPRVAPPRPPKELQLDLSKVPNIFHPQVPKFVTSMRIYRAHRELAMVYAKVKEDVERLEKQWDEMLARYARVPVTEEFKRRCRAYCGHRITLEWQKSSNQR